LEKFKEYSCVASNSSSYTVALYFMVPSARCVDRVFPVDTPLCSYSGYRADSPAGAKPSPIFLSRDKRNLDHAEVFPFRATGNNTCSALSRTSSLSPPSVLRNHQLCSSGRTANVRSETRWAWAVDRFRKYNDSTLPLSRYPPFLLEGISLGIGIKVSFSLIPNNATWQMNFWGAQQTYHYSIYLNN